MAKRNSSATGRTLLVLRPRLWAPGIQAPQPFHSVPLGCVTSVKFPLLSEHVFCSYDEGAVLGEHRVCSVTCCCGWKSLGLL